MAEHVLVGSPVRAAVEQAVSRHRGRPWTCTGWTDLADRSSHPAALLHGPGLSVFAKLLADADQARSELAGLALFRQRSAVPVPVPVGSGLVALGEQAVLLSEAVDEREPATRTRQDWRAIGRSLAALHAVTGSRFGLDVDGYFGPLRQDNRGVPGNTWAEFYGQRRLLPQMSGAYDAGRLSAEQLRRLEAVVARLPGLGGEEPLPTLLHGDAQHHNFVSTAAGAVVIDASPYYGHPEFDLALVDYFTPVPAELFAAYAEVRPLDPDFGERRELWRLYGYLAVLRVDGSSAWGRSFAGRLDDALARYA